MSNFATMTRGEYDVLCRKAGIHMGLGSAPLLTGDERHRLQTLAADAVPAIQTTASGGIPWFLANYNDPRQIEVLFAPNKATEILPESKRGDWTTQTAMFPLIESTGEVSSYGDFNDNGSAGANVTFPQRQSYHYQTVAHWGERQIAENALAKIDWASQIGQSANKVLARFQTTAYFLGIANLQNYGLLNDPNLSASINPNATGTGSGTLWSTKDGAAIYGDIVSLYTQLVTQTNGLVDRETKMVLALSPESEANFTKTNTYNVNVSDQIKKNFPNLRVVTAVQYGPTYNALGGELMQLIAEEIEGQPTGTMGFTEKLRGHPIITDMSGFKQKRSQGVWGAIIWMPVGIASMLGI